MIKKQAIENKFTRYEEQKECQVNEEQEKCEICSKNMTKEEHNFCDICDDCRE